MFLLCSCTGPTLFSFTEYVDSGRYASNQIGVEDCDLEEICGQQIVFSWNLPPKLKKNLPADIYLYVHYGNGDIEELIYPVKQVTGYMIYSLTGDLYHNKKGIISYKLSLFYKGKELVTRQHHLWTEIIKIKN